MLFPLLFASRPPMSPAARPRTTHVTNDMVSSSCWIDGCKNEAEEKPQASIAHEEQSVSASRICPALFGRSIFTRELETRISILATSFVSSIQRAEIGRAHV